MSNIRKLPIGIQDFEKLRSRDYVYIDKTTYVYEMAQTENPYFLGRPRRFGKSLFASTLKAFFEGKKHLFDGLAIAELEKDWTEYPVIYIDFSKASYPGAQNLYNVLDSILSKYETKWGVANKAPEYSLRFENIITSACEKTGKKVVVIIDEYDKPLIGTMDDFDVHEDIRSTLRGFYGVLKNSDASLRFVFITGITKFSKISLFSDMNQPNDISMDGDYAAVCGITQQELETYFTPELNALAAETGKTYDETLIEMKKRYDGYHFSQKSEGIYNPFCALNALSKRRFGSFWFETGTPGILARCVRSENLNPRDFDRDITATETGLKDYRPNETSIIPLMYQSGYLTIKAYDPLSELYTLGFPNREVKYGFLDHLLPTFIPKWNLTYNFSVAVFAKEVREGNVEKFMTMLQAYYASIPYDLLNKDDRNERYYQMIFYLLFTLAGQFVEAEVKSSHGRADAVVKTPTAIYVFEFKMDHNSTAEDALAQINDKGYPIPYSADHRPVVKIGVEFSVTDGGIKRWIVDDKQ